MKIDFTKKEYKASRTHRASSVKKSVQSIKKVNQWKIKKT